MTDSKRAKTAPSILSHDMHIVGLIVSEGDVQIEGKLDGNILLHALTVGEKADITGEIVAEMITIVGKVDGIIRGHQVHLCATSGVTGDVFHEALAVESGAHLDVTLKQEANPLAGSAVKPVKVKPDKSSQPAH